MADFLKSEQFKSYSQPKCHPMTIKRSCCSWFWITGWYFLIKWEGCFFCNILRNTRKFDRHFQTFLVKVREDRLASPYNRPIYLAVSPSALVSYQIFALHTPCHSRPLNGTFHISTKSEILNLVLRQPFQIYEAFVLIHCFVWGFMLRIFQSMFTKIGYETIKKW